MRARRVRRLYGAVGRRGGALLPDVRRPGGWARRRDGRGFVGRLGGGRCAASAPGRVPRGPRAAVRLLHPGRPHDARPVPARASRSGRARDPRGALRESVPLHRLPEHRRGRETRLWHPPLPARVAGSARGCVATRTRGSSPGARSSSTTCRSTGRCTSPFSAASTPTPASRASTRPPLAPGRESPRVHEPLPSNLAAHAVQRKGDYPRAKARAHAVIRRRFRYDRGASAAIENRAVAAQWDARAEELTVWDTTQAPIPIRNGLAQRLGLLESQVRVVAPFVGGGFGPKIMMFYPEEVLVPWATMRLGRPVKWTEDRQENFFATTQERGQIHDAELAVAKDGKILGVRDVFLHDTGAYDPYGLTVPINSQCTLLGPYDVPSYESEFTAIFTNKTIVTPVRGAGRQHGVFVIERLLDFAAKDLGIDRAEIRRKNLLRPEQFPFDNQILFQDSAPLTYDSGDYEPALDTALEVIDYKRFVGEEQPRLRAAGRHVGIGVVCYVEGTGIGPYEGARVTVEPSGRVRLATGVGTQGQGHFTVFAQIVAEVLGVDVTDVHVITGDTREFHWGTGTFASRDRKSTRLNSS